MNVLIVRADGIGDALACAPLVAALRAGGHSNSFGMTDHSFASRIGRTASPIVTCNPCVSAYSQLGWVGNENR